MASLHMYVKSVRGNNKLRKAEHQIEGKKILPRLFCSLQSSSILCVVAPQFPTSRQDATDQPPGQRIWDNSSATVTAYSKFRTS